MPPCIDPLLPLPKQKLSCLQLTNLERRLMPNDSQMSLHLLRRVDRVNLFVGLTRSHLDLHTPLPSFTGTIHSKPHSDARQFQPDTSTSLLVRRARQANCQQHSSFATLTFSSEWPQHEKKNIFLDSGFALPGLKCRIGIGHTYCLFH